MRIAIMGSGAIGLLYGGWLQHVGADVRFIARGDRLAALNRLPLSAEGQLPFHLHRVTAVARPQDAGPADIVIVAVKLYDLHEAAAAALPALAPDGVMVAVQNGVEVHEVVRPLVPAARLAVGPVFAATRLTGPTSVAYGGVARVVLGNPEAPLAPVVHELLALWRRAGIDSQASDDIRKVVWTKFVGLATNAALTCLARQPTGAIYRDPDLLELGLQSIDEIIAVGRAEGIDFAPDIAESTLAFLRAFPPATVASMRQDLDAGRRLELDGICGAIVRLGRKHGVPTPLHRMAYALLKPFRDGAPPPLPAA